jgi:hypothetical protein
VHVYEGRLHVLHDDRRYAHVLRLLLLVASIDHSKVGSLGVRNIDAAPLRLHGCGGAAIFSACVHFRLVRSR